MRVIFRVDAAVSLGTGHVMRCATLAEALKRQGAEVAFICRTEPGNMNDWLKQKGYPVFEFDATNQTDADETLRILNGQPYRYDWLVLDHYGLDILWESRVRACTDRIFVIDDLADRPHGCDVLLDQNFYTDMEQRYKAYVPARCRLLLGPAYALLRPEFTEARSRAGRTEQTEQEVKRLFIFFGGSDPTGETAKAIGAVGMLLESGYSGKLKIDVVVGASNPNRYEIQTLCNTLPDTAYHCQIDDMAALMAAADIAIGAGGTTTWERLCVGLSSIVITVADNQVRLTQDLADQGYTVFLGQSRDVTAKMLSRQLHTLLENSEMRNRMRERGMALVDGEGVRRITDVFLSAAPSNLS